MKDKIFFDTNIICYAYDINEPSKRKICKELLEKVFEGKIAGVVSNQILGEIFNAATTKLGVPLDKARVIVKSLVVSEKWGKINYTCDTVDRAMTNIEGIKAPFWDLLIAETMKENGLFEIITENEKDFENIHGIRTKNPFKSN